MPALADADEAMSAAAEPAAEGGDEDASGLDAHDIQLVMSQTNCTRKRAIEALKKFDGDIVNAIMDLQS